MVQMRILWIAICCALTARADDESARKILATQCVSCHGAARVGGLDLRSREAMLQGGARGAAVVPGKASDSILYQAVERKGSLAMPPGKKALTEMEVATIRNWIDGGAKWGDAAIQAQPAWWSFQKLKKPSVPAGAANPIDAFVLAKLKEQKLVPVGAASRRALLKR